MHTQYSKISSHSQWQSLKEVWIGGVYPDKFFDILYQNEEMFANEEANLNFLPSIDFRVLWKENISTNTKETLWKYLQLILFSTVSNVDSGESFGDTAKLFEAINQDEFKNKLEETMKGMQEMFENTAKDENGEPKSNINLDEMPNAEDIHNHVEKMMGGKLGALAKEIAEETARDLNIDMGDASSVSDVFKNLMKNPAKLMNMVKNVGSKLDQKLKSGEIKESELMKEASELMEKMKNMPGMKNMNQMLGKMGLPIGKGTNINMNAFQSHMNRNIKKATQKERMLRKLEERRAARAAVEAQLQKNNVVLQTASTSKEQPQKTGKKKKRRRRKKNGKK